jgi:uncharacterized protein (DUF342 family)
LITDLDSKINDMISYRTTITEPQITTLNDIANQHSETISNIEKELEDLQDAIDVLSGGNQSSGNTLTNILSRLTSAENTIIDIYTELDHINAHFDNFVQNGGNAAKIICSTSNPSALDGHPDGTIWLVYLVK